MGVHMKSSELKSEVKESIYFTAYALLFIQYVSDTEELNNIFPFIPKSNIFNPEFVFTLQ
jgi:hypothetical protein